MCCLFGLIDYNHSLSTRQKNRILSVLAASCEARGTDATGIAYHSKGRLRVYKRPIPTHLLRFSLPDDANVIMGHTRMTTQGDARKNFNNHPFCGSSDNGPFALAHNGVIYNDDRLRGPNKLQKPKIETDSFIAVQLLEQKRTLNFSSLRYMAEQVEGSFTFTVLDAKDNLYIVKGDNPLCLYHYPRLGIYLYASTQEILNQALARLALPWEPPRQIRINCGEILRIDSSGVITRDKFDDSKLFRHRYSMYWWPFYPARATRKSSNDYLEEVKSVASAFGYDPEEIDKLAAEGFSPEELEDFLYCGEL